MYYGVNQGMMYSGVPAVNPSPFQYPSPSQFGQQTITQNQPTQQAQQTGPDWIQVPTLQQVEQVSVQPGGKAWCMIQNVPMFALRVADNMGLITTDYYRFEKVDVNATAGASSSNNGMTREEAETLIDERLKAFADNFKPVPNSKSKRGEPVNE